MVHDGLPQSVCFLVNPYHYYENQTFDKSAKVTLTLTLTLTLILILTLTLTTSRTLGGRGPTRITTLS